MRTLWLLRHAKAARGDSGMRDHERPLEDRGRDAARRVGRFLAERGAVPERVLCSSSVRTRQTWDELSEMLDGPPPCSFERELYLASAGDLLSRAQGASDEVESLMLIAHNPGIAELAITLTRSGKPALRAQMLRKFPTCALAELRFESGAWIDLSRGCELARFQVPRELPAVP